MNRNQNRNEKALMAARSDFWEAGYFVEGARKRIRREMKRAASRARRRLDRIEAAAY